MCKWLQQTFIHRRQRSDQYSQAQCSTSLRISEMETKSEGDITFQAVYYQKKIKDVGNKVEKWNFCTCWQGCKMTQPLWNSLEVPQKIIKRTIIRSRNHSFEFMSKEDKMRMSRRYLQSHMHCCIVHKIQENCPVSKGR